MISTSSKSKVGAGVSIVNRQEKTFRRGTLMFIEGESSAEMFIIKSGKVRILKLEGESTVELAVLGPGSVLGELALLDNQPRSATAQVIEDVSVSVIDQELLRRTMDKVPSWLSLLIQVVVKRLRETMKRTSDDVIRKSIAGVIRVLLFLKGNQDAAGIKDDLWLSYVKETLYSTIGLSDSEAESVFLHLILKELLFIRKSDFGQGYIILRNPKALLLYMNFLRARQNKGTIIGEDFKENTFDLLEVIRAAGSRNGKPDGKIIKVGTQQIEIELERMGRQRYIDLDALDQLTNSKLVSRQEDITDSGRGHIKRSIIMYNDETLRKVALLRTWLPIFKEEIQL